MIPTGFTDVKGPQGIVDGLCLIAQLETGTRKIAERFRHAVRRQRLATEDGPISFTISIGISPVTATVSLEHALQRADLALYDAKNAGRNRVRVFQAM